MDPLPQNPIELEELLRSQIPFAFGETDFEFLGDREPFRCVDRYHTEEEEREFRVYTDLVAFTDTPPQVVPFKGQIQAALDARFLQEATSLIPNTLLAMPDPNVLVHRLVHPFPFSIEVFSHLHGDALFTEGIDHPDSSPLVLARVAVSSSALPHYLTEASLVDSGIVSEECWADLLECSLALHGVAQKRLTNNNLVLTSSSYMFGLQDGTPILLDGIHSPERATYVTRRSDQDYSKSVPYQLETHPDNDSSSLASELPIQIAKRFLDLFEVLSGEKFCPSRTPGLARIEGRMQAFLMR